MKILAFMLMILGSYSLKAADLQTLRKICPDEKPFVLAYSNLFVSSSSAANNHEFWFDKNDDHFKGLWIDHKKAVYLVGKFDSKSALRFCAYDFQKTEKAIDLYEATLADHALNISQDGKAVVTLERADSINAGRSYSIKLKSDDEIYYINGKTSEDFPETCKFRISTFEITGSKAAADKAINKGLLEIKERYLPKAVGSNCDNVKEFPFKRSLSIALLHSSDRIVSARVDFVNSSRSSSDWVGESFNYDRKSNKPIDLREMLSDKGQKAVIEQVQRRIEAVFSQKGRFKQLEGSASDLAISDNSLIVSFAPVDEKGWYLKTYRVDIPIPLYLIHTYFDKSLFE